MPVDYASQPERLEIPETKAILPPKAEVLPPLSAAVPSPTQVLKKWKEGSVEAALAMPLDGYGAELPKEEK